MNDTTVQPTATVAPTTKRNALLAAVGVGLAGVGLAAGLAMRPSAPETAPQPPIAAVAPPVQAVVPAPAPQAVPPVAQTEALPDAPAPVRSHAGTTASHRSTPVLRAQDGGAVAANEVGRPVPSVTPLSTRPVAVCSTCGVVEGVRTVQREGHGSGVGAVAGGVLGGVLGNRFGGGGGRTALTVLGAVGGGLAGNEAEKRTRTTTAYDVRVRMDDGTLRTFEQTTPMTPGARVTVDGQTLRLGSNSTSDGYGS